MMFPVSKEKEEALALRLRSLDIQDEDLEESFVRAGGHGGQNVNKVATCVVLVHRPSGFSVKCQKARTQGMNRYYARQMLADRIENERLGSQSREQQKIEKIRRQKRKRSKRAKEKLLADKHHRSQVKKLRRPANESD